MAGTAAKHILLMRSGQIAYLLRDEFLIDRAAPMGTSPITRTCEPGPGTLQLTDAPGVLYISGGVLTSNAASSTVGDPVALFSSGIPRTNGMACKMRVRVNDAYGASMVNIVSLMSTVSNSLSSGHNITFEGTQFAVWDHSTSAVLTTIDSVVNQWYTIVWIARSTGAFVVVNNQLAFVCIQNASGTLYPRVWGVTTNRMPWMLSTMRAGQLGGPWLSDFGIATDRLAGARSVGDTFAHAAGSQWVEFVLTTLPSSGSIEVEFRRQDANNCWRLQVTSAGAFNLIEVVGGTPTTRANIASNANGDLLRCCINGGRARLARLRAGANAYSSLYTGVATGATQTGGIVSSLGTGGAISDLITYPVDLTGDALAWVNAL